MQIDGGRGGGGHHQYQQRPTAVGGSPTMWNGQSYLQSPESKNYTISLVLPVVNHQGKIYVLLGVMKHFPKETTHEVIQLQMLGGGRGHDDTDAVETATQHFSHLTRGVMNPQQQQTMRDMLRSNQTPLLSCSFKGNNYVLFLFSMNHDTTIHERFAKTNPPPPQNNPQRKKKDELMSLHWIELQAVINSIEAFSTRQSVANSKPSLVLMNQELPLAGNLWHLVERPQLLSFLAQTFQPPLLIIPDSLKNSGSSVCKFFKSGFCKNGANCPFSHDSSLEVKEVCKFFLQGQCRYGDACHNRHVAPDQAQQIQQQMAQQQQIQQPSMSLQQPTSSMASTSSPFGSLMQQQQAPQQQQQAPPQQNDQLNSLADGFCQFYFQRFPKQCDQLAPVLIEQSIFNVNGRPVQGVAAIVAELSKLSGVSVQNFVLNRQNTRSEPDGSVILECSGQLRDAQQGVSFVQTFKLHRDQQNRFWLLQSNLAWR